MEIGPEDYALDTYACKLGCLAAEQCFLAPTIIAFKEQTDSLDEDLSNAAAEVEVVLSGTIISLFEKDQFTSATRQLLDASSCTLWHEIQ